MGTLQKVQIAFTILFLGMGAIGFNNCSSYESSAKPNANSVLEKKVEYIDCQWPDSLSVPTALSETCWKTILDDEYAHAYYDNFYSYTPSVPEKSDELTKIRHWIYWPEGAEIKNILKSSSTDRFWSFPVGTLFFQEFSTRLEKIETRVLKKVSEGQGSSHWRPYVFFWRSDQKDADYLSDGTNDIQFFDGDESLYSYTRYLVLNEEAGEYVHRSYKTTSPDQCMKCHGGAEDVALGFNPIQLSGEGDGVRISNLVANDAFESLELKDLEPWIEKQDKDKWQLSMEMNNRCGTCHNPRVDLPETLPLNLEVSVSSEEEPQFFLPVDRFVSYGWDQSETDESPNVLLCSVRGDCDPKMPPTVDGLVRSDFTFIKLVESWMGVESRPPAASSEEATQKVPLALPAKSGEPANSSKDF